MNVVDCSAHSILKEKGSGAGTGAAAGCDRLARELALDPRDPAARAVGQLVVVVHQAAAGDEDAEVGARVAVAARVGDAQVEGLALVRDRVPVGVAAHEADRRRRVRRIRQIPGCGRLRDQLDGVVGLLEDELAPGVDGGRVRPAALSSSTSIS